MSRIGKQPIHIPQGVFVTVSDDGVQVKGPHGELTVNLLQGLKVRVEGQTLTVSREKEDKRAIHGLLRSVIANAVHGVSTGFEKRLELVGTGYRVKKEGEKLVLTLGFSHPVVVEPVAGVTLETEGEKQIIVRGYDKQLVGQVAANIRLLKKPEPYKGKGVRYQGEVVRLKPGKAAKVGITREEAS